MENYVVGFMFNGDFTQVVLIKKIKPDWQKGKLNGIGGKIESNELPLQAMVREYEEETGYLFYDWEPFLTLETLNGESIYYFRAFNNEAFNGSKTTEKEEIVKIPIIPLPYNLIYNLYWILYLALDTSVKETRSHE
jgi:8-oxo-dGTP diphosphatase